VGVFKRLLSRSALLCDIENNLGFGFPLSLPVRLGSMVQEIRFPRKIDDNGGDIQEIVVLVIVKEGI
jgi:hypothetical protein